ncbi:hypothetical protein RP20_CCG001153 [Aedes albopictus]|nr:hypothetical protein RP20_CCG001153 [Aedes albopictus]
MEANGGLRCRKIRILRKALKLLKQCKVPHFCPTSTTVFDQMQLDWSEQLVRPLPRMVDYFHRHRHTIFREQLGQVTWEVRKYFVLVYFEHTGTSYERADYQLNDDDISDVEERLDELEPEIFRILTLEVNTVVQNWLFHYYGTELAMAGWQCRPGETFGFSRLCHYLLERNCGASVCFGSRMLAFAENLAKELLGYRAYFYYQTLGLALLEKLMKANYLAGNSTNNAEDILVLALRLILKELTLDYCDLWEVVYYAVKSISYKIPSLDDEIMRILVSSLIEDGDFDYVHVNATIRMLLLDLPEARIDGVQTLSISGRKCEMKEFGEHVLNRLHNEINPKNLRISTRWRLQIGRLIPNLLKKVIEDSSRWNLDYQLRFLNLLLRLTLFPIEKPRRHVRARLQLYCCLLNQIFTPFDKLLKTLERRSVLEAEALREEIRAEGTTYLSMQLVRHRELSNIILTVHTAITEMTRKFLSTQCHPTPEHHKRFWQRHKTAIYDLIMRFQGLFLIMQQLHVALEDFSLKLASLVEPSELQNILQNEHHCGC